MAFSDFTKTAYKFSVITKTDPINLKHVNEIKRSVFSPKLEGEEVRGGVGCPGRGKRRRWPEEKRWPEFLFEIFKTHTHHTLKLNTTRKEQGKEERRKRSSRKEEETTSEASPEIQARRSSLPVLLQ